MFRRVLIIVLDGVGVGALPDAGDYGDQDAATLPHVAEAVDGLALPHLQELGLGCIAPIRGVEAVPAPRACWGKMSERSAGKDSVTGHWELAGIVLDRPFATFPHGFPEELLAAFRAETGCDPLGNVAASGTDIIRALGEEHVRSGRPIVYTSSDSVFQIAAHEDVIRPETLYDLCRSAEKVLEPWDICRVIARPFRGCSAADFYRTAGRHDFARRPPAPTLMNLLQDEGIATRAVGKIHDLYAGEGFRNSLPTSGNADGMQQTLKALNDLKRGLVMTNLVDFDMLYGHRSDAKGFAVALEEFDAWLPRLLGQLRRDDLLIITADHGCDPTTGGTDHTREYVPLLAFHESLNNACCLGLRHGFSDVGATVAENFGVRLANGVSFLDKL